MTIFSESETLDQKEATVFRAIQKRYERLRDEHIKTNQLLYRANRESWMLSEPEGTIPSQSIRLSNYAEAQLLNRLSIPTKYIRRCESFLKAQNINYWLSRIDKQFLFRWIDNTVRGVLSDRYSTNLDDRDVFPVIFKSLRKVCGESFNINGFAQTSDFTVLNICFKDIVTDFRGDTYIGGITITNSEVGRSSVWIRPSIRLIDEINCFFDFIDCSRDGTTCIRHIGQLNEEKIFNAVSSAKDAINAGIYRILNTACEIINPIEEIEDLVAKSDNLTQRIVHFVEEEYEEEKETTRLQLAKTILVAIKDLPLFKQHLAQKEVGRYLNLFSGTEERLKVIIQDLEKIEP